MNPETGLSEHAARRKDWFGSPARRVQRRLHRCPDPLHGAARSVSSVNRKIGVPAFRRWSWQPRSCCFRSSGAISSRRSTPDSSGCTCAPLPGTRLESTKVIFSQVEEEIRGIIPEDEIELVLDNIGLPAESFNFAFGDGATIGTFDGEILVALKEAARAHPEYIAELRRELPQQFPGSDVLLPAGRHRQPDSELRPAGPDRHPDGGLRSAATIDMARKIRQRDRARSRRGGRARAPGDERSRPARRSRPDARRANSA